MALGFVWLAVVDESVDVLFFLGGSNAKVKKLKGSGLEADLPMLRVPEKVKNVGLLMITSQRGLCGGYNAFVFKKTKARIQESVLFFFFVYVVFYGFLLWFRRFSFAKPGLASLFGGSLGFPPLPGIGEPCLT